MTKNCTDVMRKKRKVYYVQNSPNFSFPESITLKDNKGHELKYVDQQILRPLRDESAETIASTNEQETRQS